MRCFGVKVIGFPPVQNRSTETYFGMVGPSIVKEVLISMLAITCRPQHACSVARPFKSSVSGTCSWFVVPPLRAASARVCREAGATVATNIRLRDLNVVAARHDDRCLEIIAIGLPLWGGVQLAVDSTLVSAFDSIRRRTQARSACGAALRIARRAKERTYPELLHAPRCCLVVWALKSASDGAQRLLSLSGSSRGAVRVLRLCC